MIYNIPTYLCSADISNTLNITNNKEFANHQIIYQNGRLIIAPKQIDSSIINPENLLKIKDEFDIKELLLIDKVKNVDGVVTITDHVNTSGKNFLRGKTPHGELPQFPDMSKIYGVIEGYKKTIAHTVGPERFKNQQTSKDIIYSELVGLIALVAHYVGIKIFALGLCKPEEILDII